MNSEHLKREESEKIKLYEHQRKKLVDNIEIAARLTASAHNRLTDLLTHEPAMLPGAINNDLMHIIAILAAAKDEAKNADVRARVASALLNQ